MGWWMALSSYPADMVVSDQAYVPCPSRSVLRGGQATCRDEHPPATQADLARWSSSTHPCPHPHISGSLSGPRSAGPAQLVFRLPGRQFEEALPPGIHPTSASCCQIGQIRPSNKNLRSSISCGLCSLSGETERRQDLDRDRPSWVQTAQRCPRYRVVCEAPGTPLLHPITPSPSELGKCCVLVAGRIIATSTRNKSHPALAASQYFRPPCRLVPVLRFPVLFARDASSTGVLPYPRPHLRRPRPRTRATCTWPSTHPTSSPPVGRAHFSSRTTPASGPDGPRSALLTASRRVTCIPFRNAGRSNRSRFGRSCSLVSKRIQPAPAPSQVPCPHPGWCCSNAAND